MLSIKMMILALLSVGLVRASTDDRLAALESELSAMETHDKAYDQYRKKLSAFNQATRAVDESCLGKRREQAQAQFEVAEAEIPTCDPSTFEEGKHCFFCHGDPCYKHETCFRAKNTHFGTALCGEHDKFQRRDVLDGQTAYTGADCAAPAPPTYKPADCKAKTDGIWYNDHGADCTSEAVQPGWTSADPKYDADTDKDAAHRPSSTKAASMAMKLAGAPGRIQAKEACSKFCG